MKHQKGKFFRIVITVILAITSFLYAQDERTFVTRNENGSIPTICVFVEFIGTQSTLEEREGYVQKITGPDSSISSYLNEISYERINLQDGEAYRVRLWKRPGYYRWGLSAVDMDRGKAEELTVDVINALLRNRPEIDFQDKLVVLILNSTSSQMGGRGAMCLVPSAIPFPAIAGPSLEELFIGPLENQSGRYAALIGEDFTFEQYMGTREAYFNNESDQFAQGVVIFCTDAMKSCAVHDVMHAIKRVSHRVPTAEEPGLRARALCGLYNYYIQDLAFHEDHEDEIRSHYCAPNIGWWDNMGEHAHIGFDYRDGFMDCEPYGACGFTKMKLDILERNEIRDIILYGTFDVQLAPLASQTLPSSSHNRLLKIKLTGEHQYLLAEFRWPVEGSSDQRTYISEELLGDPSFDPGYETEEGLSNPPLELVSDTGLVIYHVNENLRQVGCPIDPETVEVWPPDCPAHETINLDSITTYGPFFSKFVIFAYTPSMRHPVTNQIRYPVPSTVERMPMDLKKAAFGIGEVFRLNWQNQMTVTLVVNSMDSESMRVRVDIQQNN